MAPLLTEEHGKVVKAVWHLALQVLFSAKRSTYYSSFGALKLLRVTRGTEQDHSVLLYTVSYD